MVSVWLIRWMTFEVNWHFDVVRSHSVRLTFVIVLLEILLIVNAIQLSLGNSSFGGYCRHQTPLLIFVHCWFIYWSHLRSPITFTGSGCSGAWGRACATTNRYAHKTNATNFQDSADIVKTVRWWDALNRICVCSGFE